MKLKFTPRWQHLVLFAIGSAMLVLQYATKALEGQAPITVAGFWTVYGTAIVALFQHNVMQPNDDTRNPGLLKTKSTAPPPMPLSDSGEDTKLQRNHMLTFACFAALIGVAVLALLGCGAPTAQEGVIATYAGVIGECTQVGLIKQADGWTCFNRTQALYCDVDAGIANVLTDGGFCKDGGAP